MSKSTSGCPFHAQGTPATTPATPGGRPTDDGILAATRTWVQKAVIGLNLCPFANATVKKQRLHIQVSHATEPLALLDDLRTELRRLLDAAETDIETTLLVCPDTLADFLDFNDFLDTAETLLDELALHGIIQIASFHPHYQFAGTDAGDIENATNQSPWPTLHLLRETSIDRAVAAWGEDTDRLYENNMARLRAMGPEGWRQLRASWQPGDTP